MKRKLRFSALVVLLVAGAIGLSLNGWTRGHVVEALKQLAQSGSHGDEGPPKKAWLSSASDKAKAPWDRILRLNNKEIDAIGLKTAAVKLQTEPMTLRLSGTTDYDPATVTVVRTQFDSRVDKVLVDLGSTVRIDQPLLELFSNDLAEAKSSYEGGQQPVGSR